ncbi:UNVERIFIED_CONTAM: hypothetical protein Sradi_0147000 [Sesamum radiatum]|uniref:RNase H type-1 domain-containing protein n=1 Tax=Sesamum radiatum TaxID=300843 RepID=A0AAW2WMU5_SESRA
MEFTIRFDFKALNNEVEYEALATCMRMSYEVGAHQLVVYLISQLIVKQIDGTYKAKDDNMVQYLWLIEELTTKFESFQLIQIPREENAIVDYLFKLTSSLDDCRTRRITIKYLLESIAPLSIQVIFSGGD